MEEAIATLRTTRPTFYRLLKTGKIRGVKVGRQWRFDPQEIDRFLKGEEPQFQLPGDIKPLIATLQEQLRRFDAPLPPETDPDTARAVNCMITLAVVMRGSDIRTSGGLHG